MSSRKIMILGLAVFSLFWVGTAEAKYVPNGHHLSSQQDYPQLNPCIWQDCVTATPQASPSPSPSPSVSPSPSPSPIATEEPVITDDDDNPSNPSNNNPNPSNQNNNGQDPGVINLANGGCGLQAGSTAFGFVPWLGLIAGLCVFSLRKSKR